MAKTGAHKVKKTKRKPIQRAPAKDHKRDFEQLLDDAIFGV
jgi:hypothetical protein